MSLQPRRLPAVPADTARVAKAAFRKGSLAVRILDERFQDLFGDAAGRGSSRPS